MMTPLPARCPAPVAPLPPLGSALTLTFSMPIDSRRSGGAFTALLRTDCISLPSTTECRFRLAVYLDKQLSEAAQGRR